MDTNDFIELYRKGLSIYKIANIYGVSPSWVYFVVKRAGVNRTRSEALRLQPRERFVAMSKKAVIARQGRGREITFAERLRRAKTRELRQSATGPTEKLVVIALSKKGIHGVAQKAIGPYNCDLAVGTNIAVEILSTYFRFYGKRRLREEKRLRNLLNWGWNIIYILLNPRNPVITNVQRDNVVSKIQEINRHPTEITQYWMIGSSGQILASGGFNDDNISLVPPFRNSRDPATGRYKRVPR